MSQFGKFHVKTEDGNPVHVDTQGAYDRVELTLDSDSDYEPKSYDESVALLHLVSQGHAEQTEGADPTMPAVDQAGEATEPGAEQPGEVLEPPDAQPPAPAGLPPVAEPGPADTATPVVEAPVTVVAPRADPPPAQAPAGPTASP